MHNFKCDNLKKLTPGSIVDLEGSEKAHVFKILHLGTGEKIGLLDGNGTRGTAEISHGRTITLLDVESCPPPEFGVHLYIAPPKRQKLDLVLKQSAELGVKRIVPVISARSVAIPKAERTDGRWRDVLFEGCKQSGNPFVPVIEQPISFADAVKDAALNCEMSIYGSPRMDRMSGIAGKKEIAFFVGPEGGFTEDEEKIMDESGFKTMKIGDWTLRVETAVTAGVAVLQFYRKIF